MRKVYGFSVFLAGFLLVAACKPSSSLTMAAAATPPPADAPKVMFVGSSKSNVYHLPGCRSAKQIAAKNLITFASREEATKAGYRACEVCKP